MSQCTKNLTTWLLRRCRKTGRVLKDFEFRFLFLYFHGNQMDWGCFSFFFISTISSDSRGSYVITEVFFKNTRLIYLPGRVWNLDLGLFSSHHGLFMGHLFLSGSVFFSLPIGQMLCHTSNWLHHGFFSRLWSCKLQDGWEPLYPKQKAFPLSFFSLSFSTKYSKKGRRKGGGVYQKWRERLILRQEY